MCVNVPVVVALSRQAEAVSRWLYVVAWKHSKKAQGLKKEHATIQKWKKNDLATTYLDKSLKN